MGATVDSLDIQIASSANKANAAIDSIIKNLGKLSASLKVDTSSLEKFGNINGNNFKKLGEGLQSFANAAKSIQNVNSGNFTKLANGLERIASIDSSKLESLGKIDGNSFKRLGEGVKSLSSGLQNLQGVKKSDFNRLATGIDRLASIQPGNMEAVGSALRPLADGINVLSNAKFDNKNLQNFINSLTRLANSNTASLSNIDFASLGNSIKGLAETLSGAEKVQQNTISMTNAIAKLASAGENANITSAALPQLGLKLKEFMQTMSGAAKLETDTIAFTQALAQLANAGKKAESAAAGLPKLGEELKKVFDVMSNAPRISDSTIKFTQALAKLASAGGKASSSAGNLAGKLNTLSYSMKGLRGTTIKAVGSLKSLAKQFLSSMGIYLGIYGAIRGIKNAIDISSSLTEVQNVVDVTFQDMAYKVEEFAETSIEKFGMSELALKQYSSRFQAMGSAMGIDSSIISQANENLSALTSGYVSASDSMSDVSLNLTKLTADMASFYNVEQDVVAEDLAAIFTGQTRPLRDYGLDLTQATLQEWALKQGIDADIQSMSQAEKTMLRYQYVLANTGAAQGDFARTANTWANQVRILKQNFEQLAAVIGRTFINALKPVVKALNTVMSHIISFAKTVSNALGKIFGWKFEEGGGFAQDFGDAAGYADDIEDSTGGAAKNIKKMQAGLRAFDELNVIEMPDDNDGAGGKGAGGGLGNLGGGAAGGNWIQGESLLKDYESEIDSLYKLGEYIGKTLTDAMNNIDWESVYESARNFGKGLADFLNGLISPELFGALGRTIAGSLNTSLQFLNSFGKTFDWENFGESISTGIWEAIKTLDFELIGETLSTYSSAILDTLAGLIEGIEWSEIPNLIQEKLTDFFEGFDWKRLFESLGNLVGVAFKAWFQLNLAIGEKIAEAIIGIKDYFLEHIKKELSGLDEDASLFDIGINVIKGILKGILEWKLKVGEWIYKNIFEPFIDGFKSAFGIHSPSTVMQEQGNFIMEGLINGISEMISSVAEKFTEIKDKILEKWEEVKTNTSEKWSEIKSGLSEKWTEIKENSSEKFSDIKESISDKWSEITSDTSEKWSSIKTNLSEKWSEIKTNAKTKFSDIKNEVSNAWESLKTKTSSIWDGIRDAIKNPINGIIGFINKMISGIATGINSLTGMLNNLKIDIPNGVPFVGGMSIGFNIPAWNPIQIPLLATGGFPEDGWFRANHGEIMGRFDNGQSVVANNEQITQGIADAVYPAVYNAVMAAIRNGDNTGGDVSVQLNLDGNVIYKDVVKRAREGKNRNSGGRLVLAEEVY